MKTLIITRHNGLMEYLRDEGLIPEDAIVQDHASEEDVKDAWVIGVLPMHLAVHARAITTIPLNLPIELRGVELTKEQVSIYAGEPITCVVTRYDKRKKVGETLLKAIRRFHRNISHQSLKP